MSTELIKIIPVLPSADIARDISWYNEKVGFQTYFFDNMYAVLYRENLVIHLQWHADTESDPLLGGSVIRIYAKNIRPIFDELVERGTIAHDAFKSNTPWETNEFVFFDLNRNAIFIMEDLEQNRKGSFLKIAQMTKQVASKSFLTDLHFETLSKSNWSKFVELFGEKGACGNCWCMLFRLTNTQFEEGKQANGNKASMKEIVWKQRPTGILAFYEDMAIGWCAFAPREDFPKLERSRVHKRIDDKAVWSIPCFFIRKDFRRQGVSVRLLKAVIQYAKENGIKIIEAYPAIPTQEKLPDAFAWIGLYRSFEQAGFKVVDNTSKNRPMVRYYT